MIAYGKRNWHTIKYRIKPTIFFLDQGTTNYENKKKNFNVLSPFFFIQERICQVSHIHTELGHVIYLNDVNSCQHIDGFIAWQLEECTNNRIHFHVFRQRVLPNFQRSLKKNVSLKSKQPKRFIFNTLYHPYHLYDNS